MMDKTYIEQQYRQAVREYAGAVNENAQWTARKTMARLERIAMQDYGFDYSDQLHTLCEEVSA